MWLDNLLNTCVSREKGSSPTDKNSMGRELNDSPIEFSKIMQSDFKLEQTQSGLSNFYQSFRNFIDKFSHVEDLIMTTEAEKIPVEACNSSPCLNNGICILFRK